MSGQRDEQASFDQQLETMLDNALAADAVHGGIPTDLNDKILHLSSFAHELEATLAADQSQDWDLTQAILELTHSQPILDEALSANIAATAAPDGLAGRIVSNSEAMLAMRRSGESISEAAAEAPKAKTPPQGLEGWIYRNLGARRLRIIRQMAAAIILAAEAGIWFNLIVIADDARALVSIRAELRDIADSTEVIAPEADPFNDELDTLRNDLVSGRITVASNDWGEEPPTLDEVMDRTDASLDIPRNVKPLPVLDFGAMDIENYPY